jgi:P-type conjugative transfer protein TrbJ
VNVISPKAVFSAVLAVVVFLGGLSTPRQAQAFTCVTCAQEWTQIMNNVELVAQYEKQVQQYATQLQELQTAMQQYQNMVTQGLALPDQVWNSVAGDLQKLANVYQGGQQIAHSLGNIDQQFKQQFASYGDYAKQFQGGKFDLGQKYEQWAQAGYDNTRTALKAAGAQASMFASEDQVMRQLLSRSQSAQGRMQAIQVGNEIAAQQVQQMQKLRELLASQSTLQANWIAQQVEQRAADDAFRKEFRARKVQNSPGKDY